MKIEVADDSQIFRGVMDILQKWLKLFEKGWLTRGTYEYETFIGGMGGGSHLPCMIVGQKDLGLKVLHLDKKYLDKKYQT